MSPILVFSEDEFRKIAEDDGIRDKDYRMRLMDMSMTDDDTAGVCEMECMDETVHLFVSNGAECVTARQQVDSGAQHGFAPVKYQDVASGLLAVSLGVRVERKSNHHSARVCSKIRW